MRNGTTQHIKRNHRKPKPKIEFDFSALEDLEDTELHRDSENLQHWRRRIPNDQRQFISWDGEGAKDKPEGTRQSYVLFGNSTGDKLVSKELRTMEMLQFIIQQGEKYPQAFHVGFAFDYDANMILRNLPPKLFEELRRKHRVRYKDYFIEHIPAKWFQVTYYYPQTAKGIRKRTTVRIADIFGFFQCSFLKAIRGYLAGEDILNEIGIIEKGKEQRNRFTHSDIDTISRYWAVEIEAMRLLANKLRELIYHAGFNISQWHGPGVLANYGFRQYGIAAHKSETSAAIYDASRFGYAGGRFERFRIGAFFSGFSLDINSAYPYAISRLPSLAEGSWNYISNDPGDHLSEFAIYHIRIIHQPKAVSRDAGPLFHRDSRGNITFPWCTDGWYWTPEATAIKAFARALKRKPIPGITIEFLEGWEYTGWETRPFSFIPELYEQRREWKRQKIAAEKAIKLFLNSLYGKMAQRVGWERTGEPPPWHQLEWAGYVTSFTRAKLFAVMLRIPSDDLIAVETDGIYTTATPESLGITNSSDLGGWEIKEIEKLYYVQSGMYAKQSEGEWEVKYRGLDADSISPTTLQDFLISCQANEEWPNLIGPTTRFIGYRQALWRQDMGMGPMKMHHCKWETDDKELSAGRKGKRQHTTKLCRACQNGSNAFDEPHDTYIISRASLGELQSHRHDIPWIADTDVPEWRAYLDGELVR